MTWITFDDAHLAEYLVIDYAFQQKVIPRKFAVDELFDDTTRVLGL